MSSRALALAAVVVVCVICGAGYVTVAALTADGTTSDAQPRLVLDSDGAAALAPGSELLVRAVDYDNPRLNGRLFTLTLAAGQQPRTAGDLACERVHENAAGAGLCLAAKRHGFDYEGVVYGAGRRPLHRFSIPGVPDRARVSPDSRYAGFTAFLSGHTYSAGVRSFSTHTAIVDMRAGKPLFNLDELEVTRDGEPFERADANFWGVAFTDGDHFYATLGSGRNHYLLEARVSTRRARVIGEHIECPSPSPDSTRIAYKRRIGKQDRWRLHVLDLRSGRDVPLSERRSIDDQPEWLDNDTIVYSDDRNVYAVPADGSGRPHRIVARASSPVALR
jgi:hypothetical protein